MNKCFITKLPSSVDNDNLPVLGQLRINWLKQNNLTNTEQRRMSLATNDSIIVKVSGAHFTDSTLTSNLGDIKTINAADGPQDFYVSNDTDAVLTIDNKYSLTKLSVLSSQWSSIDKSIYFNLEDIKYCINLKALDLSCVKVSGDISALSNLINLSGLNLQNTLVTGDINALSNLTNMSWLVLNGTKISGDISALSNLTNITGIFLSNTQLRGNVDNFAGMTRLKGNTLSELKNLSLAGDMSKIPPEVSFISQAGRKIDTNFTWTANGRQNATILAMEGNVPFDTASMDNMFIDQATCTLYNSNVQVWFKSISVRGTRTSASDDAIATLQSKGVTIYGVTKES